MGFLSKLFNSHEKELEKLDSLANQVIALEENMSKLTDEELRLKTQEFQTKFKEGIDLDDMLVEAFAVVREAAFRVLGMKHYKVQIMGGIALHLGNISEMKTGEGKTLVSTLPAYLNGITGKGVFIVTVNDYLAQRDCEEMGQIHEFLGLKVGIINRDMSPLQKKEAYKADIIYGTNSEFGFDYLRDNMALSKELVVQRDKYYAIIDEVDSVLVDEARTPLIITNQGSRPSQYYKTVDKFVKSLKLEEDYEKDEEKGQVHLTQEGMTKSEKFFGIKNIADANNIELIHHIRQSLVANYHMKKDQDYVVKNDEILIVDKFTGRLMPGRRFSNGLHQSLEAKENVTVQKESKTIATITYQNYFRMFEKISGMTGTAYTEKTEFEEIYGMKVIVIPTNHPLARKDHNDMLFKTAAEKRRAIVKEVKEKYEKGQPVLIGTIYIDQSETISELLNAEGIPHRLLNAKQDKNEALIISMAGQRGAITIATNMAGRGTDIKLGEGVSDLGGLFVLGTERHDSRRIDNQLRGRSGRQGDPGESRFYLSLEDKIFDMLGKEKAENLRKLADKLGVKEDEVIEDPTITKAIESVQTNIENMNYRIRKATLEFDKILNKQRETIYAERNKILNGEDKKEFIKAITKDVAKKVVDEYTSMSDYPEEWKIKELEEDLFENYHLKDFIEISNRPLEEIEVLNRDELLGMVINACYSKYDDLEETLGSEKLRYLERLTLMRTIDEKWMEHLDIVEQLRQSLSMQHVGQQDPVRIFNVEAFDMFEAMLEVIKERTIKSIFALGIAENKIKKALEEQESRRVSEEERLERVGQLEDKYMINRNHIMLVREDIPKLSFDMDINAKEEIEVDLAVYYMENGYEELVESTDYKKSVKDVFKAEFIKPEGINWKLGWHQIKANVMGQEASVINFVVVSVQQAEKMEEERKRTAKRAVDQINFYSPDTQKISYELQFPGLKDSYLKGAIYKNNKELQRFDIETDEEGFFNIELSKPKNDWKKGLYHIAIFLPQETLTIPFLIANRIEDKTQELHIPFEVKLEVSEGKSIKLNAELIDVKAKTIISTFPIEIQNDASMMINLKPANGSWKPSNYEFRVSMGNKLIMTEHFFVL